MVYKIDGVLYEYDSFFGSAAHQAEMMAQYRLDSGSVVKLHCSASHIGQ